MRRYILIIVVLAVAAFSVRTLLARHGTETLHYRLVSIERGDLEETVSATGSLDAVTTVQVGTQVSGIIEAIYADFNDTVRAGQVIARIDTTLLSNTVASSRAQLERARAEKRQAQREFQRISALHDEGLVSDSEANEAQYNLDVARASVTSAEADLKRANQNMRYATITAPIDGTVIDRAVDPGQTVQASFSAPELFQIAGDLRHMQILAAVDESDIGLIKEGQTARFTVQAYPEDTFSGVVRQVRLQSASEENVVSYVVVVNVENPDRKLLPGMTATVQFLVQTAPDVLHVANAALRFQPDEDVMMAAMEKTRPQRSEVDAPPSGQTPPGSGQGGRGLLWTLDEGGDLKPIPVRTGLSDGTSTQIDGRDLSEGLQVVAGVSSQAASATRNPFQQQNEGNRRAGPPPPGGF